MKIILSPAKKMNINTDTLECQGTPVYLEQTKKILLWMRKQTRSELQELWGCNDKIAEENFRRIREMDLNKGLTPAILSYEGIAYQYMAEKQIKDPVDIKEFDRLGYSYRGDLSSDTDYVFERIS